MEEFTSISKLATVKKQDLFFVFNNTYAYPRDSGLVHIVRFFLIATAICLITANGLYSMVGLNGCVYTMYIYVTVTTLPSPI